MLLDLEPDDFRLCHFLAGVIGKEADFNMRKGLLIGQTFFRVVLVLSYDQLSIIPRDVAFVADSVR